ncbi:glycerophosphodiester phosphodiesterase GDPDL3-like [Gastrolobium bilobum]|uniref:glycerophosphodiester phosphodiesterase GDPDL3-like n=1 Tax=Gastrolobium bilobum TaxID=150636 RepID=UPI002AB17283|nr:glycerophosphodiester phosphodiesterase GDPDL3-like [Gastrolobium bilobum]
MWEPRAVFRALPLLLLLLHSVLALVSAKGSNRTTWNTLGGKPPLVIAHGGFSGIFPDSSSDAFNLAKITGSKDLILWCDVQLTKDGAGICLPDIKLENCTDIAEGIYGNNSKSYSVNGVTTRGYISVDYTLKELSNVFLIRGVLSRTNKFDGMFDILTVDGLVKEKLGLWLNIQHDAFYAQHNLSMRNFILSVSRRVNVNYISSPEAGFLRSIRTKLNLRTTKLVFRFLGHDEIDPSTNETYGSLLKKLTFIKTFASGILVPKGYIWPVDTNLYLLPHTSLVSDAHKVGLEVFASDFGNDFLFSYNYSYDPLAEYLHFIDNGYFSVDGVLSDFPLTASEALGCFALIGANAPKKVNTLVISKYGASGDYPACTDSAYEKAISDGADVLDCPVQMSKDGIPFCLSSIDLKESTTVVKSSFIKLDTTIPEIKSGSGIFTFNLAWDDIKHLTPSMLNPYASQYSMYRNPEYNRNVKFLTLSDFLNLTKSHTSLSGVMIIIEHAAYLAEKQSLSVTDAVIDTLTKEGYDKPGSQKVMIQSTNSSVLLKFKEKTNYELVYKIDEIVGDVLDSAVKDIKRVADSVVVDKKSVYAVEISFLTAPTNTVSKLKSSNLSVYVETFSNEFVSQTYDFYADATVEINTFVNDQKIDGIITDFPKTANRYRRNRCLNLGEDTPPYMKLPPIGGLLPIIPKNQVPPAEAPAPPLTESEVIEPPLPPVSKTASSSSPVAGTVPETQPPGNAQAKVTVCFFLSILAVLVASLLH